MFSKTGQRLELTSSSQTYVVTELVMVVPPGVPFSAISKLLSPFDWSVWIVVYGLLAVVVIIITILKFQSQTTKDFVFGRNNQTPLLNVVNVLVGVPVPKLPTRNFARWLLTMFVLLWLVVRSLYQALMYENLQSTERNLPVQSIAETVERGFIYYMISPTQENVRYLPEVYNRRVVVSSFDSHALMMRFDDPTLKAGFLGALDTVRYTNKVNLYNFKLNICKQPLLMRHYGIFYPKGSFLDSTFDNYLLYLNENGLIEYWLSQEIEVFSDSYYPITQPIKLSMNHLIIAYQILLIGFVVALFSFLLEMIPLKLIRRRVFKR